MEILMLSLLGISLILFLVSFFQKDPYKELKDEMDQLTLQYVQELYQIKKKLKILEEELLLDSDEISFAAENSSKRDIHKIIKNQVWALAQQGKPIEQIASQASLSTEDVYSILREYSEKPMN